MTTQDFNNIAYNMDCLEAMRQMKDNQFDLAIVDPPYGININTNMGRRKGDKKSDYKKYYGNDRKPERKEYFNELFRVSGNQIIWGANHFIDLINKNSNCWLVWDKCFSEQLTFSQVELAYTSFTSSSKKFEYATAKTQNRIHPTQKPVALYKWLLTNYAKQGDKILDTHLGSGSSRIACYDLGFDFTGYELDKEYFDLQEKRFERHVNQIGMF